MMEHDEQNNNNNVKIIERVKTNCGLVEFWFEEICGNYRYFSSLVFLIKSQLISNNMSTVTFTQIALKPLTKLVWIIYNLMRNIRYCLNKMFEFKNGGVCNISAINLFRM